MRLIRLTADYISEIINRKNGAKGPLLESSALTLGAFDGLHRGHWELIGGTQQARERLGLAADVVFTFKQHPRQLLAPASDPFILTTWRAKLSLLHKARCQVIVAADFCDELAQLPYEEFVAKFLVGYLGMKHLVVGYDVHLGADRGGNAETLAELGKDLGYTLEVMRPVKDGERIISSSAIRQALAAGDLDLAGRMLGRPFAMWGEVVPGDGRGRKIGYPTANIVPLEDLKMMPDPGVYAVKVQVPGDAVLSQQNGVLDRITESLPEVDRQGDLLSTASNEWAVFGGMLNFGYVPTFHEDGLREPRLEAHIFDFSGNLRGRNVKLFWMKRLRGEKKFFGAAELTAQLADDESAARRLLGLTRPDR